MRIWLPRPPAFDRIKNFDHYDLTAKHCYFGCSRSSDVVDRVKILIKMTRLQKNIVFTLGHSSTHMDTIVKHAWACWFKHA